MWNKPGISSFKVLTLRHLLGTCDKTMEHLSLDIWSWLSKFERGASWTWNKNAIYTSHTSRVPGILWANIIFLHYGLFHQSFFVLRSNIALISCVVVLSSGCVMLYYMHDFLQPQHVPRIEHGPSQSLFQAQPLGNDYFLLMFWITVTCYPRGWVTVDCYKCYCPVLLSYTHQVCFIM